MSRVMQTIDNYWTVVKARKYCKKEGLHVPSKVPSQRYRKRKQKEETVLPYDVCIVVYLVLLSLLVVLWWLPDLVSLWFRLRWR